MNNIEISGASSTMHLNDQIKWMCKFTAWSLLNISPTSTLTSKIVPLSAAVIIIALTVAFVPWTRKVLAVVVRVPLAFFIRHSGLRALWRQFVADHSVLDQIDPKKLARIYRDRQERKVQRMREQGRSQNTLLAERTPARRNRRPSDIEHQAHLTLEE